MFDIQPHQIIYLEHEHTRLYVEAIQMVKARKLCWARPLVLLSQTSDSPETPITPDFSYLGSDNLSLYALNESPDILWPIELFHPALDTEVLPLLSLLGAAKQQGDNQLNRQRLRQFIQKLWAANQKIFEEKTG